jgi:hypothetical protein
LKVRENPTEGKPLLESGFWEIFPELTRTYQGLPGISTGDKTLGDFGA